MIDLHSHVLPGIDDGPRTLEESVEMARAMAADGVTLVAATPHVRDDYPTPVDVVEGGVRELRAALAEAGVAIEVRPGGEVAVDWADRADVGDLRGYGLAGNPGAILVEFPYLGWPLELGMVCNRLLGEGMTPILAHPERNDRVQAQPERLDELVARGVLVQLTASSVTGRRGSRSRKAADQLLDAGLAHLVSSDAHRAPGPGSRLSDAAAALNDPALAHWLLHDVPAALVAGGPIPDRPNAKRRRLAWRSRLLRREVGGRHP
jgi:protein-tyrosine phosphatase